MFEKAESAREIKGYCEPTGKFNGAEDVQTHHYEYKDFHFPEIEANI